MKKNLKTITIFAGIGLMIFLAFACNDDLNVQQAYGFDLVTMPVQKRINLNETVEIRCKIVCDGDYQDAKYYIRMFQGDGKGELSFEDGTVLLPNDLYALEKLEFRLYYTSKSEDQQNVIVYIEDSFGQVIEKSFSWQSDIGNSSITEK